MYLQYSVPFIMLIYGWLSVRFNEMADLLVSFIFGLLQTSNFILSWFAAFVFHFIAPFATLSYRQNFLFNRFFYLICCLYYTIVTKKRKKEKRATTTIQITMECLLYHMDNSFVIYTKYKHRKRWKQFFIFRFVRLAYWNGKQRANMKHPTTASFADGCFCWQKKIKEITVKVQAHRENKKEWQWRASAPRLLKRQLTLNFCAILTSYHTLQIQPAK